MSKYLKSLLTKRDGGASSLSMTSPSAVAETTDSHVNANAQDTLLMLAHLRKVFNKVQQLKRSTNMVIKVLSVLKNNQWEECFPEFPEFSLTLAK
ncbi:unnamed protein product [Didymodactylos carnosus]|uniref:Uncharacterized protein n=1 Tax=Didymodactylos carnosus TaxID=1234261 RepID=A0A816E6D1_9BILA|nr:unnamed protein product [Didymodactylos carnosus]CAF1643596.1 unnamed protein product [Didymodactylos carnosus]CAF3991161.1 unnamed protein product [Didymodactylos carnosus]CAF4559496.1 unnamed protein product [Didymodactylos carnosus]